jgi:hypothetical protein
MNIDYQFADKISTLDYNMQKYFFISLNRPKDDKMDFVEEKLIDGFEKFILINLTENQPMTINRCLFTFFMVFPIFEIY